MIYTQILGLSQKYKENFCGFNDSNDVGYYGCMW